MQAHPEIGVLGNVVGVPGPEASEKTRRKVIRAPTQRHRQAQIHKAGQEEVEPRRVLEGEPARNQVLMGVVVVELGLDTTDVAAIATENDQRLLELLRLRNVLSV